MRTRAEASRLARLQSLAAQDRAYPRSTDIFNSPLRERRELISAPAPDSTPVEAASQDERLHDCGPRGMLIDSAAIPGGGTLHLFRQGKAHEILFGDEQLMGSWATLSERALATLVVERLGDRATRMLIGGLGMGFTLAAARSALGPDATILVAELVPKVEAWARGPLAHIFGDSLADPRVSVQICDVHDVIVERHGAFDAILLDVDNGPEGLISLANERLYCNWGLRAAQAALRPGGVLAIWSAFSDDGFSERLRAAHFDVEVLEVEAGGGADDPPHVIWLATRQD